VSTAHTNPNIEQRGIGGLGVPLILRLTEQTRYTALPAGNRITLVFRPR
jgi:anti-sigma regulatory factor (Ser/Thr protein kinase)